MDKKAFERANKIIIKNLSNNKNYDHYLATAKKQIRLNDEHFCKFHNNELYKRVKDKDYLNMFIDKKDVKKNG